MSRLFLTPFILFSLFQASELLACSCVQPPENSVLFERAKILVRAKVSKIIERRSVMGEIEKRPTSVEAKIVQVYKGDKSLIGKKVKLVGSNLNNTCAYIPPGEVGASVTLEGPEPYSWTGGCNVVWSPEAGSP
jgi:hypothetical protein